MIRRGVHPGWLAAAALVILGLGRGALFRQRHSSFARGGCARGAGGDEAQIFGDALDQYASQADLAVSILTASDMQPIAMAGRENATASTARAYWSPTRGLLIVADELPMPPPGRIYQVWVIGGGTPVSAGLLGEQGSGRGMLIAPAPTGVAAGTVTVAVTDEPPGGLAGSHWIDPVGRVAVATSTFRPEHVLLWRTARRRAKNGRFEAIVFRNSAWVPVTHCLGRRLCTTFFRLSPIAPLARFAAAAHVPTSRATR